MPFASGGFARKSAVLALFALALAALCPDQGYAGGRVALVIGNSSYQNFDALPNTRKDEAAIAKLFTDAKFDIVDARSDVTADAFRRALRDFSSKSSDADIAVVYFAGHGIEAGGTNYLLPVDAKLENEVDLDQEAVSLDSVLHSAGAAHLLRLVILDACRDNPFVPKMRRVTRATPNISSGLAAVEIEVDNTYVAYAAKAGSRALDGSGDDSPFTAALIKHLTTPGLDIRLALGQVRDDVVKETKLRQEPWSYGTLGGNILSLNPVAAQSASTGTNAAPKSALVNAGALRSLHGAWQVRCALAGDPPQDRCAVVQSVVADDRPDLGMTMIFLKSPEKKLLLRVIAPLGTLMPAGLGLRIDDVDKGRARFERCLNLGCVAEVVLDDNLSNGLSSGKTATLVIFQTPESGLGFPIPLNGLAAGLAALP